MSGIRRPGGWSTERDDGRVLVLGIGLVMLLILAVVGAVDTTAILLARMRMYDAADAAALSAADAIDAGSVYRSGVGDGLRLTDAGVGQAASVSLSRQERPTWVTQWGIAGGSPDGRTAVVQVSGAVRPPITGGLISIFGQSVPITVESHARAQVG